MKRLRSMWMVPLFALLALALSGCGLFGGGTGAGQVTTLTLGFIPSVNATNVQDTAKPIADLLEKQLGPGYKIKTFVAADYNGLIEAMGSGKVDIGMLNPFGYVLAHQLNGTEPLLKSIRFGSDSYRAQIFVHQGSGITDVSQLKGKKFAFVDPASTSGHLFAAAYLIQHGINPDKDLQAYYAGSHDKAVLAVYNKDADAGASFDDARTLLKKNFPDVMEKVVVIAKTDPIPNDGVSVRKGLSSDLTKKLADAFTKAIATDEGKKLFKSLYQIDGFAPAKDSDYDIIRQVAKTLNLDLKNMK